MQSRTSVMKYKNNDFSVFIWNISGSMFNALLSTIVLLIVTRYLDKGDADIFNIAWSISQLMATIGTYQIRMYQATDIIPKYSFRQYLIFRFITIGIMLIVSVLYIMIKGYGTYKASVVLVLCIFRAIEALTDVIEGQLQQKERLDLVGKAITYRIIITIVIFLAVLSYTKNLLTSCMALVLCYLICLFLYNLRYMKFVNTDKKKKWKLRDLYGLMVAGTPLFINSFLMMSITNSPKMVIDKYTELGVIDNGVQTIFGIIFLPASFLSLAYIVFRPLITKMATVWIEGKKRFFIKIIVNILLSLSAIAVGLLAGTYIFGESILSIIFNVDLSHYLDELMVIVFGGCLYTYAIIVDNAMIVMRKQHLLIFSYVISWIYSKCAADYMFEHWGLTGISALYAISMGIFLIVNVLLFLIVFLRGNKTKMKYCMVSKQV